MSYRNYGSWSKGDLSQNYSSGSTKTPEPSATAKKYDSSYSRSKPEPPAPKENVRSTSTLDKNAGSNRYNSTSTANLRNAYSPATYSRDKTGAREKESTITAISNRYANYSVDEKPEKQSVLSKYMNAKSNDKKSDSLSSASYGRSTTNSAGRPRSRDSSPVDKSLYGYGRNISSRSHNDSHDEASSKSKLSSVIKEKMNSEREKDIPSKTTKTSSYTVPSYPSYKLYTRSNTYTRPLVKDEPKIEPVNTATRYNISTNRFGSVPYSRSPIIDKPSLYVPHISSSPSTVSNCSSPKSTGDFNFNATPTKDEVKTENKECQNGNDTSKEEDEEVSESEEESSESDDQSMITLDVVTRGTSPTAPCSSTYMRTRRADMAKTIEKTITRSKKKVTMVDKEMQSDRLDDSTRTSRYASTSRTAVSPWSSYMDTRYTSTASTGRYSSGLSGSRYSTYTSSRDTSTTNTADKSVSQEDEPSSKKSESSIPIINISHDNSRSRTPTQSIVEQVDDSIPKRSSESSSQSLPVSESFKEQLKLSPPRSIPVKDKSKSKSPPLSVPKSNGKQSSPDSCCNLPPQVPKADSSPLMKSTSSIHSLNKTVKSTGKKIIKKVRSKDGETKKRLIKRSVSISSGDSESSVQCGDTDNDCVENSENKKSSSLKKTKSSSGILKVKSSADLKTETSNKNIGNGDNAPNRNSKSRSRTSLSLTSSSTETNSAPTSESEDDVVHESKTMHVRGKPGDSSRTSVMASSADEVSLSLDKPLKPLSSPNSLKNDTQPRTEEAKSFLMRALAPVTSLFKMRSQESDKGNWLDSTGESDNQNTLNVVSIETDTDSKSLNNKPHKIRHIESGEKAWWMESNSENKNSENKLRKSKSTTKSKSFDPPDGNAAENFNGFQFKIIRQESGEKPWWLESNANIPEGIEVRTPSRKGSSESEHSEKYDFYKIRHVDSGEKKEWWKSDSDKSKSENKVSNGDDNFTLNVVRIRHIESGEKAWWLASNKNIPEGVQKIESSDDSDSDSSSPDNEEQLVNGVEPVTNGVSGLSRFPLHLPDYEYDEPLGDRKSPEGLETPIVDEHFNNRASPYDNVTNKYTAKRKESVKHVPNFISRHMDIDDILGSSGHIFSPMMNRILARKTGREIVEGDNSECREIDPGQVRIHDSTAQRPVIQRTRSRSDIIDCRDVDQPLQLDDSALQVYKDGDLGPYLDLESSLNEQQEDLEGFHTNRKNSIILRTQLSVRVHAIIEKLLNSEGRELRRALFSLKQIFQEDKDLVHEFVQNDGLDCLIRVGADADQNYQNYILRALGQVMLYVDGMNGLMAHNASLQWLYSLVASKFRLVVKTTLKLLLVFVEYVDSNCSLLIEAIEAVDCCQGVRPWTNIMNLLKDYDASDTELLIYTMTLINKCLNGVSDRDAYYNQTDWLEEQGMYNIIQRYMARQGTDLDLLRQFQIYEAVLSHEDGDDHGAPLTQLDDSIRRTLRSRKSMSENSHRRSIRHSANGTVSNGDVGENGASHYNQAFLQTALSDEQASEDIRAVVNSPDQDVFRDSKEIRLTKEKRRLRIQRQREFAKEQNELWSSSKKSDSEKDVNEDELSEGHPLYTSGLQQRIQNGTLGHTGAKDYMSDVTSLNNQLNDLYFDKKATPRADMKWMKIRNENGVTNYEDENGADPVTDKKPLLVLSKEQSVKDITEKLRSPNKTIEEIKFNLAGDLSGLFSKAMEGLKKSKSKGTMKTLEKSEFDATWEKIKKSLKRELIINNLDFTDLCEDNEDSSHPLTDNTSGNATLSGQSGEINDSCRHLLNDNSIDLQAPPPPPFSMPPPPPLELKKYEDTQVPPPPPNSLHPRSSSIDSTLPANKLKTIKLFWREIPTSHLRKNSFGTVWDELSSVNIDKQKLQILFENKTKETMKKQTDQIKSKELVILDQRRSNAINIALKKLPPSQAIKNAIIKMDNSVLIKEMVEKVLSLIPTEEETVKIQEAQIANPSIPLGTAEQFLITLSSITELNSRLKLWVFKLDFELIEADISEKLFDLKQAIHILKNNSTFKNILSVILTIGGFLNGTGSVKGFQIEYLSKISEVKDTLNKNSLMHTICEVMEKEHQNSSDLYSEIGAVTRAGKINIADICTVINKLEEDCKVSTNCYKRIIKHDTSLTKLKLGDFLTECLERIVILQVVRQRILIRAKTFLQWLGVPDDSDICENFKIISEFALEYRTTRERVLEQNIRKKAYRERSQTRGKLITENATASEKESLKNILISAPGFSRKRKELLSKGEDASEQLIEDVFTSLLKKGKKSQHKTSNKKLIKRSRTREGIHEDQQLLT